MVGDASTLPFKTVSQSLSGKRFVKSGCDSSIVKRMVGLAGELVDSKHLESELTDSSSSTPGSAGDGNSTTALIRDRIAQTQCQSCRSRSSHPRTGSVGAKVPFRQKAYSGLWCQGLHPGPVMGLNEYPPLGAMAYQEGKVLNCGRSKSKRYLFSSVSLTGLQGAE